MPNAANSFCWFLMNWKRGEGGRNYNLVGFNELGYWDAKHKERGRNISLVGFNEFGYWDAKHKGEEYKSCWFYRIGVKKPRWGK